MATRWAQWVVERKGQALDDYDHGRLHMVQQRLLLRKKAKAPQPEAGTEKAA